MKPPSKRTPTNPTHLFDLFCAMAIGTVLEIKGVFNLSNQLSNYSDNWGM